MHVCLCIYMHKFVHVHAHFNFALLRKFYGVFSTYKNKSFVKTCRHMPLSLPPPPWPQLFDQPPIPNRLPRSQFLSDSERSSGKIYLPPLTNASVTCKSPSSRRRLLEIDHITKSTSDFVPLHPPDQIAPPGVNSCLISMVKAVKSTYHMQGRRDLIHMHKIPNSTKMSLPTNHFELLTLTGHIILGRILSCHLIFHGVTL